MRRAMSLRIVVLVALLALCAGLCACQKANVEEPMPEQEPEVTFEDVDDTSTEEAAESSEDQAETEEAAEEPQSEGDKEAETEKAEEDAVDVDALRAELNITEDYRDSFIHGEKGAEYQKYIVLHDTESESDGLSVVQYWDGNGTGVAAHFVVNLDGSVVQCVDMDTIAHHAGFGDAGHNDMYGTPEDGRDDRVGTQPIGDWAPDYGMNSYSIGIEMVHIGGTGYYPEEQLESVDKLIAYIDAYYGFESTIIDHKAWRSGNSDTSPEFAEYLANYQDHRTHN